MLIKDNYKKKFLKRRVNLVSLYNNACNILV